MPSIASLPSELLQQILHQVIALQPNSAIDCACVSRLWQIYAETQTFSTLRIDQSSLAEFDNILTPARQIYVREIFMKIVLPEYDAGKAWKCGLLETTEDEQRNNQVFTAGTKSLLEILATWKVTGNRKQESPGGGISLSISAYSPTDIQIPSSHYLSGFATNAAANRVFRELRKRWERSYLELTESFENLAAVTVITNFSYPRQKPYRNVAPSTCCKIASCLSDLQSLHWELDDGERYDLSRRIQLREDFAIGISLIPPSLRHFNLTYAGGDPQNHDWHPPRLYREFKDDDPVIKDPLSIALHRLALHLTTIRLEGPIVLDPDVFFWPIPESTIATNQDVDPVPPFPTLERIHIVQAAVTASGQWLLDEDSQWGGRGDPPEEENPLRTEMREELGLVRPGDDPPFQWRCTPIPHITNRLFICAGRAVVKMPCIQVLDLVLSSFPSTAVTYATVERSLSKLEIWGSPPFDPSDEAKKVWHEAAQARLLEDGSGNTQHDGLQMLLKDEGETPVHLVSPVRSRDKQPDKVYWF